MIEMTFFTYILIHVLSFALGFLIGGYFIEMRFLKKVEK